jgi:hypothetical protein
MKVLYMIKLLSFSQHLHYSLFNSDRRRTRSWIKNQKPLDQFCLLRILQIFDVRWNYGQFSLTLKRMLSKIHKIRYTTKHPNIRSKTYSLIFQSDHFGRTIYQSGVWLYVFLHLHFFLSGESVNIDLTFHRASKIT